MTAMDENTPTEIDHSERWMLIRDTAVLQVKLVIDGLRDFLLVPASLIAANREPFDGKRRSARPAFLPVARPWQAK